MIPQPIVGIDFDNTIVCYDTVFHAVAYERGLIPSTIKPVKENVRDYLRSIDREDDWTELQGFVYGKCMSRVTTFPGVLEFFTSAKAQGLDLFIVSHKTKFPYRGPRFDLHVAAREWLEINGFFNLSGLGINRDHVFFETSKVNKLARIAEIQCTHFIDDLPELLLEPGFPDKPKRLLFAPMPVKPLSPEVIVLKSWHEISRYFKLV